MYGAAVNYAWLLSRFYIVGLLVSHSEQRIYTLTVNQNHEEHIKCSVLCLIKENKDVKKNPDN